MSGYLEGIHFFLFSVPPSIDDASTSSDVEVNEGDDASLVCRADGHPKPTIRWIREDRQKFPVYENRLNHTRKTMGEKEKMMKKMALSFQRQKERDGTLKR